MSISREKQEKIKYYLLNLINDNDENYINKTQENLIYLELLYIDI